MTVRVAIVDDIERERDQLAADVRDALARAGIPHSVSKHPNAESMLASPTSDVDLAFLDIRMGEGMDGIALAERLREASRQLMIVFVTSSREFALDAYHTHPFDYLVKPYTKERLQGVLADALTARAPDEPQAEIVVPRGTVAVEHRRIASLEARDHNTIFVLEGGEELRSNMGFSQALALVADDPRFLEINRGVAINMDHVTSVEGPTISMDTGTQLPLRKRDRSALSLAITRHMVSRMGGGRRHRG